MLKNVSTRTNFLQSNDVDGVEEYDLGSMDFGDFDFGEVQYYVVKEHEVCRPDIISLKTYGTTNYWWFIMWFNGITDIWNDLREGMLLAYPSLDMLREGLKYLRTRRELLKK